MGNTVLLLPLPHIILHLLFINVISVFFLALFRFWKKAYTFTGLKLQGQLGKFGKKEITDIEGYVELPDGKVRKHNTNH